MKIPRNAIAAVVEMCMGAGLHEPAKSATKYLAPDFCVKATRSQSTSVVLTWGEPNYEGRKFVKLCQKAGESFPLKKIQIEWYPEKKTKSALRVDYITGKKIRSAKI
jgi:hypothetical protein